MRSKPWVQELFWVKRDDNGQIVRIEKELPPGAENVQQPVRLPRNKKSAAGQGN